MPRRRRSSAIEACAPRGLDELHRLLEHPPHARRPRDDAGAVAPSASTPRRRSTAASEAAGLPHRRSPSSATAVTCRRSVDAGRASTASRRRRSRTRARHGGPGATAEVRLRYADDAARRARGRRTPARTRCARPRPGTRASSGMRERAAASGGAIEIGPRARGGFLVRVACPLASRREPARR